MVTLDITYIPSYSISLIDTDRIMNMDHGFEGIIQLAATTSAAQFEGDLLWKFQVYVTDMLNILVVARRKVSRVLMLHHLHLQIVNH